MLLLSLRESVDIPLNFDSDLPRVLERNVEQIDGLIRSDVSK